MESGTGYRVPGTRQSKVAPGCPIPVFLAHETKDSDGCVTLANDELVMLMNTVPIHVRWIVKGAGPYTVKVESTKGGIASSTSALR